ncbi:MAG: PH domain-containing protein, partial [Clostridia bacterium]|nr:PH domain-containing protein [Clostridia bacterium]
MKKFSKSYVYYHLVVDFIIIFFIMLCFTTEMFLDSEEEFDFLTHLPEIITVFLVLFVIAYALKTLYSILYLNASGYQLKENEIECKRGVLFKKRSILDYKKIHAVNKKQNLIHKIFKLAVLTLDSGSTNTA